MWCCDKDARRIFFLIRTSVKAGGITALPSFDVGGERKNLSE
jgi:hypothetical protein